MTNLSPNHNQRQRGIATLVISTILLLTTVLLVIFTASFSMMSQKITANQYRTNEAFTAAEAGLEYAIPYLQLNRSTIVANPVSGFIPAYTSANTTNVTLGNNSKYSITYSNPIASNYTLILISSTGTSADGTATHTVSQLVQFGAILASPPATAIISKGSFSLNGLAAVFNLTNNSTITSGSSVNFNGVTGTFTNQGLMSYPGHIGSDVQQNSSSIANMSQSDFFATYFGASTNTVRNNVANYYQNSSDTNYNSTLNGVTGTSIWIDQNSSSNAILNGNTTIGSQANPVLLIINGNVQISGNVTITGMVVVLGTATISTSGLNSVNITGGLISTDSIDANGIISIAYSSSVISNLQSLNSMTYFAKVPGSWKDF